LERYILEILSSSKRMIKELTHKNKESLIEFLNGVAPDQVPFVEGAYFEHGENISFGWFEENELVGCIRYCIQDIGYEQKTPLIKYKGEYLKEAKINAFAVSKMFRNKGIGRELQMRVIRDAKERGCSQVASYSTFDKVENYSVKLGLGFCVQTELQTNGTKGCFFLMKL